MGTQSTGAVGTVLSLNPASADGYIWVPVNFNSGVDGWVAEDFLVAYVAPTPTPTPTPTPVPTPTPAYTLTVTKIGNGTVTGTGINCGTDCTETVAGGSITLTAAPAEGSTFTGWSGACTGTGSCIVTMSQARAVTATFTANATPTPTPTPVPTPLPSGTVSLFGSDALPKVVEADDEEAVNLGVKFKSSVAGKVTGIRFYKGTNNTGTHVGVLWSSNGTKLAEGTFTGETASGWQTLVFTTPVAVKANTTYVASYRAPKGNYAADKNYFSKSVKNGVLTAGTSNGVYRYGSLGFPNETYNKSNYWVDVLFTADTTTTPTPSPTTPTPTPTTPTPTPTPEAAAQSIFSAGVVPSTVEDSDTMAVNLGVKFKASQAGKVTGIRFYKGVNNTGTHAGVLWSSNGTKLAEGTFTGETASGWQTLTFTTPVEIAANTTYVASYRAPNGKYAGDTNFFANAVSKGSLTVPASGGVYSYGSVAFPTETYQATNYWVDVVFVPSTGSVLGASYSLPETFSAPVVVGTEGSIVAVIQRILNQDPDTMVASVGAGSTGHESNYFGAMTRQAVERFQKKYNIVATGTPETTGFGIVGPRTWQKMKEVLTH